MENAKKYVDLQLVTITVIGLYGEPYEFSTPADALSCIHQLAKSVQNVGTPLDSIRITAIYQSDEVIHGNFKSKKNAQQFIERFID